MKSSGHETSDPLLFYLNNNQINGDLLTPTYPCHKAKSSFHLYLKLEECVPGIPRDAISYNAFLL